MNNISGNSNVYNLNIKDKFIVDEAFWQIPASLSALKAQASGNLSDILPKDPRQRRKVQKPEQLASTLSFEQNLSREVVSETYQKSSSSISSANQIENINNNVNRLDNALKKLQAHYSIYSAPIAHQPIMPTHPNLQSKPATGSNPNYVPKVICKYYMEGKCSKGSSCTFSHALQPNKTPDQVRSQNASVICSFYRLGQCMKGSNCLYSHDLSRVPCKYFHKNNGRCKDNDQCRFSHRVPLDEEETKLLEEILAIDTAKKQNQDQSEKKIEELPKSESLPKGAAKFHKNKGIKIPHVNKPIRMGKKEQQNTNFKKTKALESTLDTIPYYEYEPLPRAN